LKELLTVNVFQSLRNYENYIYSLKQNHQSILRSTLVVAPQGKRTAMLQGEISFAHGYRITVWEQLSTDAGTVVINEYGNEFCAAKSPVVHSGN
jgi:hypothetical protein